MDEQWFAVLLLLLVVGVVFEVWFGKTIGRRKWLQGGLVTLSLVVAMSVPSCSTDDAGRPDGPDIPYSF